MVSHEQHIIYVIKDNRPKVNTYQQPIYIGITKQSLQERLKLHFSNIHSVFYNWHKLYGKDPIIISPIHTVTADEKIDTNQLARDLERKYINQYIQEGYSLINRLLPAKIVALDSKKCHKQRVICLTTNETFNTITSACAKYNVDKQAFVKQTKLGWNAGIDKNNQPLFWKFENQSISYKDNKKYVIYAFYDKTTKQYIYVGTTNNLQARIRKHIGNKSYHNVLLYLYFEHYSNHSFEIHILENNLPAEKAYKLEVQYIIDFSLNYELLNKANNYRYSEIFHKFCFNVLHTNKSEDELKQQLADKTKKYIANKKPCRCITTGEEFDSCASAALKYHCNKGPISKACKDRSLLKDMYWEYIETESTSIIGGNIPIINTNLSYLPIKNNIVYKIVLLKYEGKPYYITYRKCTRITSVSWNLLVSLDKKLKSIVKNMNKRKFTIDILKIFDNISQAKEYRDYLYVQYSRNYDMYINPLTYPIADVNNFKKDYEYLSKSNCQFPSKRVLCTTTNTIFPTITMAAQYAHVDNRSISNACNGKYEYAGILSDGRWLRWQFI